MTLLRTESFVPLTAAPAPPGRREFSVAVIRPGAPAENFQSLESTRTEALPALAEKKICEPRVSVQRDNGRVTHLRVQCTCGQVLDLACNYDAAPAKA
jgi:hypothetical protein